MTKRLFLFSAALFFLGLAPINAQPFAYITSSPLLGKPSIMVLNLANKGMVANISGFDAPHVDGIAISPDGSRAAATAGNSLLLIDTATNKITATIRLGNLVEESEVAVSPDGRYAYITGPTSGAVWVVNLENKTTAAISTGGKPADIAVTPDGSQVYVSGCGTFGTSLCVINAANNTVTSPNISISQRFAITPDGKRIYAVYSSSVVVFDIATNSKVATINLGNYGKDVVIAPDGKRAYASCGPCASYRTTVIDTTSNKIIATANATGIMAISPDGKRVYALHDFGQIYVIDTETNTVFDEINLPSAVSFPRQFRDIAITPGPRQKPGFSAAGVVNAASYQGGGVAPGEIVTIFGSAIGPPVLTTMRLTSVGLVDNLLADTRVLFDGIPAPLVYVWQNQNSVIVPYAAAGKSTTQVQVEYKGLKSEPVSVRVVSVAPGIFTLDSSGKGQGAVLNENMTINSASNPASRGSIVVLYATGEGQTNPPGVDGKVTAGKLPKPLLPVSARIGGVPTEILYAGAAPGLVAGVIQVNVRVPSGISPGNAVTVVVTVGSTDSQQGVTIAVR